MTKSMFREVDLLQFSEKIVRWTERVHGDVETRVYNHIYIAAADNDNGVYTAVWESASRR